MRTVKALRAAGSVEIRGSREALDRILVAIGDAVDELEGEHSLALCLEQRADGYVLVIADPDALHGRIGRTIGAG